MPGNNNAASGQKRKQNNRNRRRNQSGGQHQSANNTDNILTSDQYLGLGRAVGFAAALSVGIALCLGSYVDITASDGPANFILPFIIATVVAGGLGAGWHVVLAMGAEAETNQKRGIAFAIGVAFTIVGIATSAWFLAGKIGGSPAIQIHQTNYLHKLLESGDRVASNHAVETDLALQTKTSTTLLEAEAQAEGEFGKFSGFPGFKGLYQTLKNAADALLGTFTSLQTQDRKRRRLLTEARQEIETATQAVADRDDETYKKSASRAAILIAESDRIRISGMVGGLSLGSAPGDAGKTIRSAATDVGIKAAEVSEKLRPVSVPIYVPIDAKTAVTTYPKPLPWLMAILLEALPLLMLSLLIYLPSERAVRSGRAV